MSNAIEPRQGQIVWADLRSPRGQRKTRPVVLISPTEEFLLDQEVVGVAITTSFPQTPPDTYVELPWDRRGHPATSLRRRSAAVCDWLVKLRPSDIVELKGYVPTKILLTILDRISQLSDDA